MSQYVPQANDFVNVTNLLGKIRMVSSQPGQRFADNLKLTFNDQLQCAIFLEILEAPAVTIRILLPGWTAGCLLEALRDYAA